MAFDSNRSGISITIGSIGSYIHIGIYCLRVSILTFIFVIDRVYGCLQRLLLRANYQS